MNSKKLCISLLLSMSLGAQIQADERTQIADERQEAFNLRIQQAYRQTLGRPQHTMTAFVNPDEEDVPGFAGSFTKPFNHDAATGLPTLAGQASFKQLIKAVNGTSQAYWNAIQLSPGTQRVLINPQAGLAFSMEGCDSSLFTMPTPPAISSAQAAAEIIETYLMMICRGVKFEEYGTGVGSDEDLFNGGSKTNNAAMIMTAQGAAYIGPKNGLNQVDASLLFRGNTAGDRVGPFISQFLVQPLPYLFPAGCAGFVANLIGVQNLPTQIFLADQLVAIPEKREFGVSWDDFVAIENGLIPKQYAYTDYNATQKRYLSTGRDIGGFVHVDGPYEPYYNAMFILAGNGFPISPYSPYANGSITKESAGFDMGAPDAFCLVGGVCLEAFKAAWAQKWRCWRRLRPEAMAGLVHQAKVNDDNPFNLDAAIFATYSGIDLLAWVRDTNALQATAAYDPQQLLTPEQASTYLLAQMYPEGSPTHPAYPSGHATVGGACSTVIKAIFNDQALIKDHITPVKPNPADLATLVPLSGEGEDVMTVGGELNKLASNIAFARNFGGVHSRWEGEYGMQLGEAVAIRYLQDHCRTYPEEGFTGYVLTKRDGVRIRITASSVEPI